MPKTKAHLRSSRRVASLKDNDIDHEISLVDHSTPSEEPRALTPETDSNENNIDHSPSNQPLIPSENRPPSTQPETEADQPSNGAATAAATEAGPSSEQDIPDAPTEETGAPVAGKEPAAKENGVQETLGNKKRHSRRPKEPETAIEILYENQRGGFLCGIPLFSSAALGNLDPPPWTNFVHKTSPTDIHTAQVPDPSWEWAWPEWRVNYDEATQADSDGWEYSFMFSKKFSWHGPKWYSSFVRRRTWIRRRIKKGVGYQANGTIMGPDYFSVVPSKDAERGSVGGLRALRASHETRRNSRDSGRGDGDEDVARANITTTDELMKVLRRSRIDRERLEAAQNHIENCSDELQDLQNHMHEIMALFVFQASRKLLLTRLIQLHDDEADTKQKGKSTVSQQKADNLAEAIKHADEEVRRLEYWSDIKGMAESGASRGAVDCDSGWDHGWEGLDNSGPKGVKEADELP
ncbi:hypothetical protein F4821DRAFT_158997 [Hypoxylon rubiginosum]|uniref:Uncharacterized protein n=1 Tax=Hypoxylon rubiginosum TaxID=110542 RepID=A0ACC0DI24_9PEZI|nr:hypothetical protein F4821DRAFT_158997 [Hypoxylon rubiginosum]